MTSAPTAAADEAILATSNRRAPVMVNARFLTKQATGVDRFAVEVLREWLPRFGTARRASLVAPACIPPGNGDFARQIGSRGRLNGHWWEQLELAGLPQDVVLLNLCNTAPLLRRRQLVVLHDAAALANPRDYTFAFRTWYRMLFHTVMRYAKVIASVSRFSADELIRVVGTRRPKIEIIYESGEHILRPASDPSILGRLGLSGERYVLAVGSLSRNKNFRGVVRAAAALSDLGVKIVAAGGRNARVYGNSGPADSGILQAGYVSDGELRALYEHARCFVFPSFYEGFGLPPLEAMHCGCPVIVSRRASMPEICGDAALYCDPDDPADIARCMRRMLTDAPLRDDLRAAGLAQSARFTWARASQQLEDIVTAHFDATS